MKVLLAMAALLIAGASFPATAREASPNITTKSTCDSYQRQIDFFRTQGSDDLAGEAQKKLAACEKSAAEDQLLISQYANAHPNEPCPAQQVGLERAQAAVNKSGTLAGRLFGGPSSLYKASLGSARQALADCQRQAAYASAQDAQRDANEKQRIAYEATPEGQALMRANAITDGHVNVATFTPRTIVGAAGHWRDLGLTDDGHHYYSVSRQVGDERRLFLKSFTLDADGMPGTINIVQTAFVCRSSGPLPAVMRIVDGYDFDGRTGDPMGASLPGAWGTSISVEDESVLQSAVETSCEAGARH
ncbi:MAG TPA: hypothetical protein VGU03_10820 [Frateuria sp.]|uniref:hypothetical protein n=1 Tax=Frateuria sp. TaxID=2211372 RepID=UPI002DE56A3B|nr:hypothetical protein [Frateuria sp.]